MIWYVYTMTSCWLLVDWNSYLTMLTMWRSYYIISYQSAPTGSHLDVASCQRCHCDVILTSMRLTSCRFQKRRWRRSLAVLFSSAARWPQTNDGRLLRPLNRRRSIWSGSLQSTIIRRIQFYRLTVALTCIAKRLLHDHTRASLPQKRVNTRWYSSAPAVHFPFQSPLR